MNDVRCKTMLKFLVGLAPVLLFNTMVSCSSEPTAVSYDPSTNPSEAISRLNEDITTGLTLHYDVLAQPEFDQAQKQLERAKDLQVKNAPQEKILDRLGVGRAYLNKAKGRADELQPRAQEILTARTQAIDAGARNFARESNDLKIADDALRSAVGDLQKAKLSPQRWAKLQGSYLDIELSAIQDTKLGAAEATIEGTRKNGGPKNAPYTFKQAEFELQNAKSVIATDRHNDEKANAAVDKANHAARFLADVLAATKQANGRVSEETAIKLVRQSRKITALDSAVSAESVSAESKDKIIAKQKQALTEKDFELSLNKALNNARKEFKPEEAEVFREGDKLLIRLKGVGFATNRAEIPPASIALLSKVRDIAQDLNPEKVVVEGHTDSLGDQKINMELSKSRAEAVATYFEHNGLPSDKIEAVGYGYQKPLETNKTKAGRATNRRVDVIISPGKQSKEGTQNESKESL